MYCLLPLPCVYKAAHAEGRVHHNFVGPWVCERVLAQSFLSGYCTHTHTHTHTAYSYTVHTPVRHAPWYCTHACTAHESPCCTHICTAHTSRARSMCLRAYCMWWSTWIHQLTGHGCRASQRWGCMGQLHVHMHTTYIPSHTYIPANINERKRACSKHHADMLRM